MASSSLFPLLCSLSSLSYLLMIPLFLWASGIRIPEIHLPPAFLSSPTFIPFFTTHRSSFQSSLDPSPFPSIITIFWYYYCLLSNCFLGVSQLWGTWVCSFFSLLHFSTAKSWLIFLIIAQYDGWHVTFFNEWHIFLWDDDIKGGVITNWTFL